MPKCCSLYVRVQEVRAEVTMMDVLLGSFPSQLQIRLPLSHQPQPLNSTEVTPTILFRFVS